jgi:tight adherence protein B
LGVFILLAIVLGMAGYLVCFLMTWNYVVSSTIALFLCGIPFYYLMLKRKRRIDKFQKQFPEGLELISRALRAGHAITSGMALAAEEFDDPLGSEFGLVIDEINFGSSITDALKNFADRIGCLEVKYFVVSLIIQRESGGNLSEIIEKIAHIIRERFKLQGKIRALAGEGKFSAIILIALPFVVIAALRLTNPKYIDVLFSHPVGRLLVGIAGCMMAIGMLVMKRMINIKV